MDVMMQGMLSNTKENAAKLAIHEKEAYGRGRMRLSSFCA